MPVRDAAAVLDRLRSHAPHLWIDGKPVDDPTTHPSTANACRSLAALYDMQTRPDLVDTMTFTSPTSGDPVGMSFIVPEYARGPRAPLGDAPGVGQRPPRVHGPHARLPQRERDGGRHGGRLLLAERPAVRPQHGQLLRARPRARPGAHARAHQPAGRPVQARLRARRSVHRARRRARDERWHHRPRGAHAGDAADLRRDPDLPVDGAAARRRHEPLRDVVRRPERHARTHVPVSRAARPRSLARRPPARLALRRDGRDGLLRRRARAVGAGVPDERRRRRQPRLCRDRRRAPHGAPGGQPQDRQDRGDARHDAGGGRHDRHRSVPARAGDDRRDDHRARDHEEPARSRRKRGRRSTSTA